MFETSKDILNLSIAVSVAAFAGFTCWAIYYFARILQQVFRVINEMRQRLAALDELIKAIKDKIESTTSYLLLISEGVKKLVEVIKDRTSKKKRVVEEDEEEDEE